MQNNARCGRMMPLLSLTRSFADFLLLGSIGEWIVFCTTLAIVSGIFQHLKAQIQKLKPSAWRSYPPGPFPWPFVGNAPFLGAEAHKTLHSWAQIYGPVFRLKLGGVKAIVLSNMRVVRAALSNQKHTFSGRPMFPTYKYVSRGEGIVFNDVQTQSDRWQKNRSVVVRHLHKLSTSVKMRSQMNERVTTEALFMIKQLEKSSHKGFVNPEDIVRMTVANSVCSICFGKRYEYDNKEFCELLSMNTEFGAVLTAATSIDAMPWITILPKFRKAMQDYLLVNKRLDLWTYKRVEEIFSAFDHCDISNLVESITSEFLEQSNCEIDGLKQSERETISALVEDVFAAGQHTTSSTFFWVLTYLLNFQDVFHNIKEELERVVGDRLPNLTDRRDLPYMEAFLHETFRHSSLLTCTLPHMTLNATDLAGYHIPRGTMVMVNQYSVNHDPETWNDPGSFDPTRFLTEKEPGSLAINERAVDKYMIFSLGIRKCPGADSSKMWLFLATAILVHTCDLLSNPNLPPTTDAEYGLVLKPRHISMKLRVRNNRGEMQLR